MIALLALHAVVGVSIVALGSRLSRRALWPALVPPVVTLAWLATQLPAVLDGETPSQRWVWVPSLDFAIDVRLDAFSALMVLLVSGVGVAVIAYSGRYFSARSEGLGRLIGLLTLFAGAMLGLVLADNLLFLYMCWELTSVTSYLLIGNDHTQAKARAAALQALLMTGAGGLAMLGGFVLLGQAAGTFQLSEILADPPGGAVVVVALGLVLLGAFAKSAQYPLHSWLPGAMVAPTPVSAYLHSATMVKAGVYLVARLAPAFALVWGWRPAIVVVGLVTMLAGGLRALRQNDLKLLLAFGTVSQLGFMMVLVGVGTVEASLAGCALLLAHGMFKAALFFVVGIIDHEAGTRDIRELDRFGRGWRPVKATAIVAAASMAGVPLTFGFIAKESGYQAFIDGGFAFSSLVLVGVIAGSMLTCAYSARFIWGAFYSGVDVEAGCEAPRAAHRPSWPFVAPAAVLATFTIIFGVAPGLVSPLITAATEALDGSWSPPYLSLWHGWTLALGLSALTLAVGAALFVGRRAVASVLRLGSRVPDGSAAYLASLRGLNLVADRSTGVVQSGSLPVYVGVILVTAALAPGVVLVMAGEWPGWPELIGSPMQAPVVAVLLVTALASATVRRRFAAALLLGTAGYAMAGLFVIQGAPDLALTQVAIETLTVVVFVLVLRRLPDRFEHRAPRWGRALRLGVAGLVAAMIFSFALIAGGQRGHEHIEVGSVAGEIVEDALPEGDGRNVVNVILVDFRAFDTLGEISVLAVAAIGAVALARARREVSP